MFKYYRDLCDKNLTKLVDLQIHQKDPPKSADLQIYQLTLMCLVSHKIGNTSIINPNSLLHVKHMDAPNHIHLWVNNLFSHELHF